jgi:hypothetical protein
MENMSTIEGGVSTQGYKVQSSALKRPGMAVEGGFFQGPYWDKGENG